MITINCPYSFINLVNEIPEGIHTYYNKRHRRFEYHYENDIDNDNLIKTPCSYEMRAEIKATFYASLDEAQKEIARSYPFKRGYFDYLKEVGLYEIYEEAELRAKLKALIVWYIKNDIRISVKDINVDCRYL